jgi:hypothetical protein
MTPTCSFAHFDWAFEPGDEVPADHPMVALRPDLFTEAVKAAPAPKTIATPTTDTTTEA